MIRLRMLMVFFAAVIGSGLLPAVAQDKGIADFPKLSAKSDWPWWRGPMRSGYAEGSSYPTKFTEASAKWKAPVPGRGHSSPIVVGDKVYLTTAVKAGQKQFALAFDRATGKQQWETLLSEGGFPANNHPKNTEATPTIASDGEQLFVTFFHHKSIELSVLDFAGKIVRQKNLGAFDPKRYEYGYAPSPVIYRDLVIIAAEYDGESFIVAQNRKTGEDVWRIKRPNNITFSTPSIAHVAGRDQMMLSGAERVMSYDPATGKELWSLGGTTHATCGTMVWDGDIVFASGGYPKPETIAIDAKGSGKVLWTNNQKCYEQSMIAIDGYVYALTDGGVIYCWEGATGKEMWKQRLQGPVSASPVYAGGHIYWANELGSLYVFKPNPKKYEQVAENKIGKDSFPSPAATSGQIFLRVGHGSDDSRQETLYCFE